MTRLVHVINDHSIYASYNSPQYPLKWIYLHKEIIFQALF